jgi:hypothetical protein
MSSSFQELESFFLRTRLRNEERKMWDASGTHTRCSILRQRAAPQYPYKDICRSKMGHILRLDSSTNCSQNRRELVGPPGSDWVHARDEVIQP